MNLFVASIYRDLNNSSSVIQFAKSHLNFKYDVGKHRIISDGYDIMYWFKFHQFYDVWITLTAVDNKGFPFKRDAIIIKKSYEDNITVIE